MSRMILQAMIITPSRQLVSRSTFRTRKRIERRPRYTNYGYGEAGRVQPARPQMFPVDG